MASMENDRSSSSSDDESVLDETDDGQQRSTRSIQAENYAAGDETASSLLKFAKQGNPKLGSRMQLFSRTNYFLAIYPDGTVKGTQDSNDLHTHLEVNGAGEAAVGHVYIKGVLTDMYLTMDESGQVRASSSSSEDAVFVESITSSNYNVYLGKVTGWYLAIKKNGLPKDGAKTRYGQNAIQFLPRRTEFE